MFRDTVSSSVYVISYKTTANQFKYHVNPTKMISYCLKIINAMTWTGREMRRDKVAQERETKEVVRCGMRTREENTMWKRNKTTQKNGRRAESRKRKMWVE